MTFNFLAMFVLKHKAYKSVVKILLNDNLLELTIVCLYKSYCDMCLIQHYMIRSVSDLRQVRGFLRVPRFPLHIKLTDTI